MQVKKEQISPCEVELEIEVPVDEVKSAVDATYSELGKRVNIPGFRKGKAPRAVLVNFLDEEVVKEHAADKLLQPAYKKALEEADVEPYAPADVDIIKFDFNEPLVFKAIVPLAPKVELGEYTGLEVERKVPEVTEEDINAEIDRIRERQAKFPEVKDRPVQEEDMVLIEAKNENEPDEEPKKNLVDVGSNLPDFDKGLIGMNLEEEKVIEVTYPEDFAAEDLRGKTVPLRTKVLEIRAKELPEVTDEWVKETFAPQKPAAEGEGEQETKEETAEETPEDVVDTVDKLKARIREAMERAAQDMAEADVRNKIIDKVVENSQIDYPNAMVEHIVHDRIEELEADLKQRQATLDDYLKYKGVSYEDLHSEYEKQAQDDLKVQLALREIVEKENIEVTDEDVDAEIKTLAEDRGTTAEAIRAYLDSAGGVGSIKNRILHKKVMDFLVHASNIKNVE